MKKPRFTPKASALQEIIVDNFAGGGGASSGIEMGLGRHVDIAINHDPEALALHRKNHPHTSHYPEDVFKINPLEVTYGRPVGLAWFSPDCKHFSKAKGKQPKSKKIRGLAWVTLRWAKVVKPRVIALENVEEFRDWGPLLADGTPCKRRKGITFKSFITQLENLGYVVDHRILRGCDYGAPTIRKRLFLIARCDSKPIVWPEPSHVDPKLPKAASAGRKPWRTAAECIDWSLPCYSIFMSKEEARQHGIRRPLAEKTMARIAKGMKKFVIDAKDPFIAPDEHALAIPYLTEFANGSQQRVMNLKDPLRTQCAETKGGHYALVAAFLSRYFGQSVGSDMQAPMGTVMGDGAGKSYLTTAFLSRNFGNSTGSEMSQPIGTVMGKQKTFLTTSHLCKLKGTCRDGQPVTDPLHTISAQGNHYAEVRAFLMKYYASENNTASLDDPMHTVTPLDRMALVTVAGVDYAIVDIGLRMLEPHELYAAQGFPSSYQISCMVPDRFGRLKPLSKKAQVRMCGNSVCPDVAAAIARANVPEMAINKQVERSLT